MEQEIIVLKLISNIEVIGVVKYDTIHHSECIFLNEPAMVFYNTETKDFELIPYSIYGHTGEVPFHKTAIESRMYATEDAIMAYGEYLKEFGMISDGEETLEDEIEESINKPSKTKKETLH